MLDCKKIKEELVFRLADNELGQELTIAVHAHVEHCPECARRAQMARYLRTLLKKRATPTPAPKRLRIRILAAFPHRRQGPVQ